MARFESSRRIQLHDFMIGSPLRLPKLLGLPSSLALKFSINGINRNQVLRARRDMGDGIWEIDGDVKVSSEDQLLTVTILVCTKDSMKDLGSVTISYSQLLTHAEARSKEYYEFTLDVFNPSVLILVTCSIRTLSPPQKQRILTEPVFTLEKIKTDEGRSSSNRALTPEASSAFSIAMLEHYYSQAAGLPAELKSEFLNDMGCAYANMYEETHEVAHLERAISILGEALRDASFHPKLAEYINDLAACLIRRFQRTGRHDDIEDAVSKSQDAVRAAETSDTNKHRYIVNHAIALRQRFDYLGKLEDLQSSISFMNRAMRLLPDGHPDKPNCLNSLGNALQERFNQLGDIKDLETAITYGQNAVDLTPDKHPEKPVRLNNLGTAVDIRFDRLGHVKDLETAIMHKKNAVDLMPDGHPNKPACLDNLGNSFQRRFDQFGHVEDLETAISHKQNAVNLTPDGHPVKPSYLSNLGCTFQTRFDRFGHVKDIETAILHKRNAVNLTPDGHPDKPHRLQNLGNAFKKRFDRLGHVQDLEIAIVHQKNAVGLMRDGHPDEPGSLNNLGIVLQTRFDQFGHVKDLEAAILHKQSAVNLTPDGHPDKPTYLGNLGEALETRFDRFGHVKDLETAIMHKQNAVDLTPDINPAKGEYLVALGNAFISRFGSLKQPKDAYAALSQYSIAASLPTGSPRARLRAVREWARTSELLENFGMPVSSPLDAYHIAIDLLPRVAWLGVPITTQHALLEDVGGIVRDAVSAAIKMGEYETAVAWVEAGRSIAWQNLLNLRTPISELQGAHEKLANRLEMISRQLDMSVRDSNGGMDVTTDGVGEVTRSGVQLALDWDNTVAEIRSKPGFESFLKPKGFNQLGLIVSEGPVVILNINKKQCDALVLIPEDSGSVYISSITLGNFTYEKSVELHKELKGTLSSKHLRARDSRLARRMPIDAGNGPSLGNILRCLWLDVVKPIIDALAYQPRSEDLPHIWWCATGPLAFLPIHAAGLYDTDEPGTKLSDYVVSSYTPTLSTLLDDSPPTQEDFRLLAIAQANAMDAPPIPSTEVEVRQIQSLAKDVKVITMMKGDATVESVWREMETSNWVHLACHGQQNLKEPMKSGLLLHDGTLELQRLIEKPLPLADFAFLSACQTATGDESVAEESLHLAAGMLFAGYKGVIATMWSIMDDIGPRVAEDVYRVMLKDGKPNRKAAAHALHEAVRRLREDPKVDMLHWVPFIHIGR